MFFFSCAHVASVRTHQGMLTLVSNCIDRLNVYNSAAHFGECAGSEAGAAWKDILNLLYELLGEETGVPHTHIHTQTGVTCTKFCQFRVDPMVVHTLFSVLLAFPKLNVICEPLCTQSICSIRHRCI